MIRPKRVDHFHICVPAEKLEEALAFYTEILGFNVAERPDHLFNHPGYWLTSCEIELHIGLEDPLPVTIRHTALMVDDVDEAFNILSNTDGVTIIDEVPIPGRKRFAFLDPFGNRMELLQYD